MLSSVHEEKFRKYASINSEHRVRAEWNFNEFMMIEDYGCYTSKTSNQYLGYYKENTGYDTGKSEIFFDGVAQQVTFSGSSGSSSITVPAGHGIKVGMRAEGEGIVADTYVSGIGLTSVTLNKQLTKAVSSKEGNFYYYQTEYDKDRINYTPLTSVFDRNRPDPGIINLVANTRYGSEILDIEKLKIANFGNTVGTTREDRIYPMYKNSPYRYWNSIRKVLLNNVPETVGISSSSGSGGVYSIDYAAPFIVYEKGFYTNKVVIKTQKYNGYPNEFKIDVLLGENPDYSSGTTQTNWTTIYTGSGTVLSDGILEIYYNGTSWSTTPEYLTEFVGNPTKAQKIHGIRFSITGMSASRISAEVIELSPRLSADITQYAMSFNKISTLSNTSYNIPTAGLVSTTGNIQISNVDRIFSSRNPNSILSGMLYEGTKIVFEQIVESESIPISTLYAISWTENSDFTTNIDLEDYFFFLKGMKSPDIAIANMSGIEASVAILILLDNAGITNYKFVKQSLTSNDDFVFEFFYTNKSDTVARSLENIANSAQYAIFVDANNIINVVTKEKFSQVVDGSNTDYWLVGSEKWKTPDDKEYNFLNNNYISNIQSISESVVQPLTEATIAYKGNGIVKNPKGILRRDLGVIDDSNLIMNASLVTQELEFGTTELWSIENSSKEDTKTLFAAAYIKDISDIVPTVLNDARVTPISGLDENDVARKVYYSAPDKSYFEIMLDPQMATLLSQGDKFEGYVLINSELIKYRGLIIDIFDDKNPSGSGTAIVFNNSEFAQVKAQMSSGSSVFCNGILVDLNFELKDIEDALLTGEKNYIFISDGRATNNTTLQKHIAESNTDMLNNPFTTKLYATSYESNIKASGTMTYKSLKLKNPKYEVPGEQKFSYPGYLKISGPKSVFNKNQDPKLGTTATDSEKRLGIDNFGERYITGFTKRLTFSPKRISTRMTLLSKPEKEVMVKEEFTSIEKNPEWFVNRGIAGLGFRLKKLDGNKGTTGYFIEIEEVGNITKKQLKQADFKNLRLYSVKEKNGKIVPKVLGSAWVNVSAAAYETQDMFDAQTSGLSYTGTSDLVVTIEEVGSNFVYRVYWEDQKVLTAKEPKSEAFNLKSNLIGLFVRSNSEAKFEHFMAADLSRNGNYPVSTIFSKNSPYMKLQKAVSRGLLPSGFSENTVGTNLTKFYYEDFGRMAREVGKYSVKFNTPAIYSMPISLSNVNPNYYVAGYTASSYGADFWVFNTSNSNINLSTQSNTVLSITGVAITSISPGETSMSEYLKKRVGEDNEKILLLDRNTRKFGQNNIQISGEYINSLSQAESLFQWILQNSTYPKKSLTCQIFPNPLLELGDKVRIFYPDLGYSISQQGDKNYYVHSIGYTVETKGPTMTISVREI